MSDIGRERLARVSVVEGINENIGFEVDEELPTSSSRQQGDDPCSCGGCNSNAWIGRASKNS